MEPFVLASASPQREHLLKGVGISFTVDPSTIDESDCTETEPAKRAKDLACMKAEEVKARHPDAWVVGCDTLVVAQDGTLLEKPADAAEAHTMIARQSGGASVIYSALCLITPDGKIHEELSSSRVHFKDLSPDEQKWWVDTENWKGRSGGFQIDGAGQFMIENIEGDWTGIVGLPVFLLGQMMQKAGLDMMG
jgi:septum formation protein